MPAVHEVACTSAQHLPNLVSRESRSRRYDDRIICMPLVALVSLRPRLVKILDNSHHFYSTMLNIVIEMTLYVRPSVRLFVTFVNDINKFACV